MIDWRSDRGSLLFVFVSAAVGEVISAIVAAVVALAGAGVDGFWFTFYGCSGVVFLGFFYSLISIGADEPESWTGKLAYGIFSVLLFCLVLTVPYFIVVGLRSIYHESEMACIVLVLAAAYVLCFWAYSHQATEKRKAEEGRAKVFQNAWGERFARITPETETDVLERLYDEGTDIQIRYGMFYDNVAFDRAVDDLKEILGQRGIFLV